MYKSNNTSDEMISFYKPMIGLIIWNIKTEEISDEQVTYPKDLSDDAKSFVGVQAYQDTKEATIWHSRELTEEDIVHEMLHIKYPEASEAWVNKTTKELVNKFKPTRPKKWYQLSENTIELIKSKQFKIVIAILIVLILTRLFI